MQGGGWWWLLWGSIAGMEEAASVAAQDSSSAARLVIAQQQHMASSSSETEPELPILFIGVSLVLGLICRHLLRGTRVPYTVALLILGIALGAAEYGTGGALGVLGQSIRLWSTISPSLILFVFLPALLFESSFSMEVHQIKRCLMQMVLLAGPGVVISTFCTGTLIHYVFPYQWAWSLSLLLGGLLSATDPVAVVALLKELGASKKLNTIIEGESLINDGTAIVIFRLFLQLVLGNTFTAAAVVSYLSRVSLGAVAVGLAFGLVSVLWLGLIFNDTVIEITLTLTASYVAYYTAEDEVGVSGVLTVMTVGIVFAVFARAAFKAETQESMHHFWEMVSYIANTLIFILSGVVIAESILKNSGNIEGRDWGYLVLLYIFLQVARVIVVVTLLPGLRYFGYGLSLKEASILTWAGLRGAVALSLSLTVYVTDESSSTLLSAKTRARFIFLTGGVVFLTLTINGSTTQFLLKFLKMQNTSEVKARILDYTKYEMNTKALEAFEDLEEDEELGPADWNAVRKYISCLTTTGRPNHPHESDETSTVVQVNQLQDTRVRLLNGVQAAYWTMLEEGRISQTAALLLMQSVDEALDAVLKTGELADWKALDPHVQFPHFLKHLWLRNSKIVPKKILNFLVVGRLELACYIAAAFLRAHRIARRELCEFIGQSDVAEIVIKESESQEGSAKIFLEDVRLTFPEVLRAVKTKQVTYAILNHLVGYIQGLEKVGLLEEKETNHLHDDVQRDLKRLLRNPPLVKMPTTTEIFRSQPFLATQPAETQELLKISAKESMRLRESILYSEENRADGVYLVANGVVKWSNKLSTGKLLLHPTFSHGSTLGLYEVLTGKPYLCTVRADSLAHIFFIEASQILAALRTRPEVEEFFWKESSLAVAKILLPEMFEGIAMHDLRALAIERSVMRTFLKGEIIEIVPGEVGLLLEGFLKQEGKEDIIVAPSVITISYGEQQQDNIPSYHVETRSRVIVFDISTLHPQLRRASTSHMSSTLALASRASFEHEGLMRWPEYARNSALRMSAKSLVDSPYPVRSSSTYSMLARKLKAGRSWRVSSAGKIVRVPSAQGQTQGFPAYGKRHMSTSALPASKSDYGGNVQFQGNKRRHKKGSSDDESDGDEEQIVRIDSPSRLFHHHM